VTIAGVLTPVIAVLAALSIGQVAPPNFGDPLPGVTVAVRLLTTFLHDGRALNLTDAILAHDGQGNASRDQFVNLSSTEKAQLIAFLGSL
jgi:CxxC motif-containing protein (DUF1111 family)